MLDEAGRWMPVLALVVVLSPPVGARFAPETERFTAFAVSNKMSVGAKIKVRKGSDTIDHEDFAAGPILLKDVKASTGS